MLSPTHRKHRFGDGRHAAAKAGTLAAAGALIALAGAGAASAATTSGAMSAQANSACPSASSSTDTSCTYTYTGSEQTFTVPSWVTDVTVQAVGAPGASVGSTAGGYGASVTATVPVSPGTSTLYVEVGAAGTVYGGISFGGGGPSPTASGGGASDVQTSSASSSTLFYPAGLSACESDAPAADCSADPRLVVAGGGGGAGNSVPGGAAGDPVAGGSAGDPTVTGPGNGSYQNTGPGGNGGFGGTAGGNGAGSCGENAAPFDGWGAALGQREYVSNGVPRLLPNCGQPLYGTGGGGGGGGYYGGGSGSGSSPASLKGGGGAGSSYWIPGATDTSMATDTTGTPEVVISYTLQQQQIAFTSSPPSPAVYGGSYTPAATGGGSGNPVTFSIDSASTAGACSISGGTVSFAGVGTCTIDANQAGGNGYAAAPQVQQSFTIGQASQAISFTSSPPNPAAVGGTYTPAATGGGSGNPVTFSIDSASTPGACSISGGTVSFAGPGTCTVDANQAGNAGYTAAPQVQQVITVDQAPSFVAASPPATATAGQAYGYTFMASGTPAPSYALSGAPSWLSIDASTGTVSGTVPAGTTSFSYSVTASNAAGTATAGPFTVTVTPASTKADLAAGLSCPGTLTVGATGTCTLTVTNHGPAAAQNVIAAVTLPASLAETSCSTGCAKHANVVIWQQSSLAAGASVQDTITVKATRTGKAQALGGAVSSSPDPNPFNNIAQAVITIRR